MINIKDVIQRTMASGINQSLAQDESLCPYLEEHQGKLISFQLGKEKVASYKIIHGQFIEDYSDATPNLSISIPTNILADAILGIHEVTKKIRIDGEAALARDINFVFRNMHFSLEQEIAKHSNPAIAKAVISFKNLVIDSLSNFSKNCLENFADYSKNQGELLVSEEAWQNFMDKTQKISFRINSIDRRVHKLIQRLQDKK